MLSPCDCGCLFRVHSAHHCTRSCVAHHDNITQTSSRERRSSGTTPADLNGESLLALRPSSSGVGNDVCTMWLHLSLFSPVISGALAKPRWRWSQYCFHLIMQTHINRKQPPWVTSEEGMLMVPLGPVITGAAFDTVVQLLSPIGHKKLAT